MKLIKFNPDGEYFKDVDEVTKVKLLSKGEMTLDEFFEINESNHIIIGKNCHSVFSNGPNPDFSIREGIYPRDPRMTLTETLKHLKDLIG